MTRQQLLKGLHAVSAFLTPSVGCFQACVGTWEISLAMGKRRKKNQSLSPQNVNEMDLQSPNRGQWDI